MRHVVCVVLAVVLAVSLAPLMRVAQRVRVVGARRLRIIAAPRCSTLASRATAATMTAKGPLAGPADVTAFISNINAGYEEVRCGA